jgi:hypothetical protein
MGRLDDARWQLHLADSVTNELALAHAATVGLVDQIDRFRFRDAADPIPAPGIYDLLAELQGHTVDAMHATTTCRILVDDLAEADEAHEERAFEAVIAAVGRTAVIAASAGRAIRHFVQIGLGVAQHAVDDDETELLERSMIGVLNAFPMRTSASADAFPFVGRTACELSVELAGVISRMLCDQSSGTDPEPVLVLGAPGTPDMPEIMIEITDDGGVDIVHDTHRRSFPPSVTITDVVSVVLCTATQTLGPNVANLTPRWEHALVR